MKEKKSIKNAKKIKESHDYKSYASTYNLEILNSLNLDLQLKDTESEIRINQID